jgi:hypothetical protein
MLSVQGHTLGLEIQLGLLNRFKGLTSTNQKIQG